MKNINDYRPAGQHSGKARIGKEEIRFGISARCVGKKPESRVSFGDKVIKRVGWVRGAKLAVDFDDVSIRLRPTRINERGYMLQKSKSGTHKISFICFEGMPFGKLTGIIPTQEVEWEIKDDGLWIEWPDQNTKTDSHRGVNVTDIS